MKFSGQIVNGKLNLWNKTGLKQLIKELEGEFIDLDLSKHKKKGSRKTHAYYRGYVLPEIHRVFKQEGNEFSIDEVHDILKYKFMLKEKVNEATAESLPYIPSSGDFTQQEWNTFLEKIKRWAAEDLNLYLLDPNEQAKIEI